MKTLLLCLLLAGCATPRYLTEEQDKETYEACKTGCALVPTDVWNQILLFIKQHSGTGI